MKMTSGWMRAGVVAAMMVAVAAGAQTPDDAAKAADAQAQVAAKQAEAQAKIQAQQLKLDLNSADMDAQIAKALAEVDRMAPQLAQLQSADMEAQIAKAQVELKLASPQLEKLGTLNSAQMAKMQAQLAKMAPMQAEMQARMAPMEAKLEMSMLPLQAEMLARSAAMHAHMLARVAVLQDGMVAVGDPQVKDDLFAGTEKFAKGASDVTDVNLGPDMLGMVSGKHGGDMAHKLNFMVVRTYEYPHEGMYSMADVDAYRQKLRSGNWNCFVHTYESKTGESTDICNRALPNGQGNEMVIHDGGAEGADVHPHEWQGIVSGPEQDGKNGGHGRDGDSGYAGPSDTAAGSSPVMR